VLGAAHTLSEAASKAMLRPAGVPFAPEEEVLDADAAVAAAARLGYPVVAKLCGEGIAHKTERGLVRLGLRDEASVRRAVEDLLAAATPDDGTVSVLVAAMVSGSRELIAGLVHDAQFGMNVMLGVGGILAEAIGDAVFCPVPVTPVDADDLIDALAMQDLLGPFRGEPPIDRGALVDVLIGLSRLAEERPDVVAVDLNPLVVVDGKPVVVDALVELRR
jgi:acetyl-CoA synthetase (ADP-forming)